MIFCDSIVTQLLMIFIQVLASVVLVELVKPMEDKKQRSKQYRDEILLLVVCYHLMCFTDAVPDQILQSFVGYSLLTIVASHLAVNLLMIMVTSVKATVRSLQIKWMLRKLKLQTSEKKAMLRAVRVKRATIIKAIELHREQNEPVRNFKTGKEVMRRQDLSNQPVNWVIEKTRTKRVLKLSQRQPGFGRRER